MDKRDMNHPYFPAYHLPENNPTTPFIFPPPPPTIDDDDDLALALSFSRLHLPYNSPPPPPFGYLVNTPYWVPPSRPHTDFLVGPVSGYSNHLAGPSRLNFHDIGQRGSVYGQQGPYYVQNNYDHLYERNVRSSLSENVCMKDLKGKIVWFAKDQRWSKVLQKKIEEQSLEDNEFVVSEVVGFVCDLMRNQFGGYFIQKLFKVCNEDQRTRIILAATRTSFEFANVCLCSHGAKTVQALMENLDTPQQISLVISALCTSAIVLSSDSHGQHVIRCCLANFSYEFNKLLLDKIVQNCIQIATNKCGCCVLQACVEYAHGKPRERLIDEVIANVYILTQDPYGNYVVQHLLGLGIPEVTARLIQHLRGKFTTLSCNKFASNVVEKLLLEAGEEYSTIIIEDLLENSKAASMLLINPYGNFVIQTALSVSKGQIFEKLLDLILANAPSIRNNVYAEKIFAWFDKRNISLDKFINK